MGALPEDDRLLELMATRAVEGLSAAEEKELEQLAARYPELDLDELDAVAASLSLSGLKFEPMPADLRARVEADAEDWLSRGREARPPASVTPLRSRTRGVATWGGWLAAAASLVLALLGWIEVERKEAELAAVRDPAPEELLAALQARPETLVLPWSATEDPAATGAEGAVVWNRAEQAGLMRFRGLAANDPAVSQYQLWIFDADRDDRFPVDGGVFDVPAGVDEVLVPIHPRVPVGEVALFAVTVEVPGGVVVSSRERIALVAQPEA
jgi:hypothetical protein